MPFVKGMEEHNIQALADRVGDDSGGQNPSGALPAGSQKDQSVFILIVPQSLRARHIDGKIEEDERENPGEEPSEHDHESMPPASCLRDYVGAKEGDRVKAGPNWNDQLEEAEIEKVDF